MMNSTVTQSRRRRMAREPQPQARAEPQAANGPSGAPERKPSKLDKVQAMLCGESGATIAEMVTATGWQQQGRGVMAGALKKSGLIITSDKVDGVRRYRGERSA